MESLNLTLDVTVDFEYTPGNPGCYTGNPDNRYPAEPAEVEIMAIYCGSVELNLDYETLNELEGQILDIMGGLS